MHRLFVLALLFVAGCSPAPTDSAKNDQLIANVRLLDPQFGEAVLNQCSRHSPKRGERYFKPDLQQVRAFEAKLNTALKEDGFFKRENAWAKEARLKPVSQIGDRWDREIVGIERGGKRSIYGNYYPRGSSDAQNEVTIVCDGGEQFFGAEYDLERGAIMHLAFNGVA